MIILQSESKRERIIRQMSNIIYVERTKEYIRNIYNYEEYGMMGNEDALCSYIDIKDALKVIRPDNSYVLMKCIIEDCIYEDIAKECERSIYWINGRIYRGLIELGCYLKAGLLLTDEELSDGFIIYNSTQKEYKRAVRDNERGRKLLVEIAKVAG